MEQFESIYLAENIPQPLPTAAAQFMRACVKGMSRKALLRIASERGLHIHWRHNESHTYGSYRLHLMIDDGTVPLIVTMKSVRAAQAEALGLVLSSLKCHRSV